MSLAIHAAPMPPPTLAALELLARHPVRATAPAGGRRVRRGQVLFRESDRFSALYLVSLGTFKLAVTLDDGREQVTAFQMAGDLLGLEALACGFHQCTATALEDGQVCPLPFVPVHDPRALPAEAFNRLLQLAAQEAVRDIRLRVGLANGHADARVAAFLLQWSARMRERGWSGREFDLRMSRAEIASCLGLASESVSRVLTGFARQGTIEVARRRVRLLSVVALEHAARTGAPRRTRRFAAPGEEGLQAAVDTAMALARTVGLAGWVTPVGRH